MFVMNVDNCIIITMPLSVWLTAWEGTVEQVSRNSYQLWQLPQLLAPGATARTPGKPDYEQLEQREQRTRELDPG